MRTRKPENEKTRRRADFNIKGPRRKEAKKNFYCFPPRLRVSREARILDKSGLASLRSFSSRFPVPIHRASSPCGIFPFSRFHVFMFFSAFSASLRLIFSRSPVFPVPIHRASSPCGIFPFSRLLHSRYSLLPYPCPRCRKVCGRLLNTRCRSATIGDGRQLRSHR